MSREFKFTLRHNIGKMAANQNGRYTLSNVLIDGNCAVASDGRALAAVPIDPIHTDDSSPVASTHQLQSKAMQGVTSRKSVQVIHNGRTESKGKVFETPESGRWPDWRKVVPRMVTDDCFVLSLTPAIVNKLLAAVMDPSEDDAVTLIMRKPQDETPDGVKRPAGVVTDAVCVLGNSGAVGVLMPYATDENASHYARRFNDQASALEHSSDENKRAQPIVGPAPKHARRPDIAA